MELIGVIKGLSYAVERGHREVEIYSDSAYVINALNKGWLASWKLLGWKKKDGSDVKNTDLWKEFDALHKKIKSVKFIKVKGHSGNMYNELADRYAREEVKKLLD